MFHVFVPSIVSLLISSDGVPHPIQYFRGPAQCIRWLHQKYGFRGLYHGFGAMLLRDVPTYGLYMLIYEVLFVRIKDMDTTDDNGIIAGLVAGGVAGVVTWTCALPMDVVKSVVQADLDRSSYQNLLHCARFVYSTRGVRGFFAGWTVCSLRAFPTNAVTFLLYEQCRRLLASQSQETE